MRKYIFLFSFLFLLFSPYLLEAEEDIIIAELGDNNEKVLELKQKFIWLDYNVTNTMEYDESFLTAVMEFQQDYQLEVTGAINQLTMDKISEVMASVFQEGGINHEGVSKLKNALHKLGFMDNHTSNAYDEITTKSVSEFQEYYDLPLTGNANDNTLQKINVLLNSPFQLGQRHEETIILKEKLNKLGFGKITVTNYYGSFTKKKVKEFQAYYGLVDHGIVDDKTLKKIEELLNHPYQQGNRFDELIDIKTKLNRLGFGNITVTNYFGNFTEKKVKEFQRYYGLIENGIIDEVTLAKINNLMAKGFQKGDRNKGITNLKKDLNTLGFGKIKVTTYYGSFTEKKVKEFQKYYGLPATGIADEATFNKIDEVLSSTLQKGKRNSNLGTIKEKLNKIGFGKIIVTNYFGSFTEKKVKEFQHYYGLKDNGIIDSITLAKLNEVHSTNLQKGNRAQGIVDLKQKLNKLNFGNIKVTNYFGAYTEKRIKDFQRHYGLVVNGIADEPTLIKIDSILTSPFQKGKRHKDTIEIKKKLNKLGYNGISLTTYFGAFTEKRVKEFQRDYNLPVTGIVDPVTKRTLENSIVNVFLDPGHGGHDPGGQGYGLKEKDVVLDIALRIGQALSKHYFGVNVNYSRKNDTFVELEERANKANNWGADYFVSIHNNAFMGRGKGFESYIHDGKVSKTTVQKQEEIHSYLVDKLGVNDRGAKRENYNVLRNTNMPAILIEYLFIDNYNENLLLRDIKYRNWLGDITAQAIARAFNLKEK